MINIAPYLLSYWNEWNKREKILVSLAAIFVLFYIVYLLIYTPLQEKIIQAKMISSENEATLKWMRQMKGQIRSLVPQQSVSTSELLTIIHDRLENEPNLHAFPYHLTQTSSGNIELKFTKVPFNIFLSWFYRLNQQYRFDMKQLNVQKTGTAGIVQLSCLISIG